MTNRADILTDDSDAYCNDLHDSIQKTNIKNILNTGKLSFVSQLPRCFLTNLIFSSQFNKVSIRGCWVFSDIALVPNRSWKSYFSIRKLDVTPVISIVQLGPSPSPKSKLLFWNQSLTLKSLSNHHHPPPSENF